MRRCEVEPTLHRRDPIDVRHVLVIGRCHRGAAVREPRQKHLLTAGVGRCGRRGQVLADDQRVRPEVVVEVEDARRPGRVDVDGRRVLAAPGQVPLEQRGQRRRVVPEDPVGHAPHERVRRHPVRVVLGQRRIVAEAFLAEELAESRRVRRFEVAFIQAENEEGELNVLQLVQADLQHRRSRYTCIRSPCYKYIGSE